MYGSELSAFDKRVLSALSGKSGVAAAMLHAWSRSAESSIQTARSLVDLSGLGLTEEMAAQLVLEGCSSLGLIAGVAAGFRALPDMHARFASLSAALFAIDFYQTCVHQDASSASVVLTKPPIPSELERRLAELGWRTSDLEPTEFAFRRMVGVALKRVVIMTPFLDVRGGEWLKQVLLSAGPGVGRTLVLRSLEDRTRNDYPEGFAVLAPWLLEQGVEVYNYSIPRSSGAGRETFHAKVVLCDRTVAYVGSSNLTSASLAHSMEMGVAVTGRAAEHVAVVLDAVLGAGNRVM